jgi:hypothetical protein
MALRKKVFLLGGVLRALGGGKSYTQQKNETPQASRSLESLPQEQMR